MFENILNKEDLNTQNREVFLFKRFLLLSVLVHIILLAFDPSHFFFFSNSRNLTEGSINIDLIAFDSTPAPKEEDIAPPLPLLPQVPKKFELEMPQKPDEMTINEKKELLKDDPKLKIEQRKEEEKLTKVSLERLLKEMKNQKAKEDGKRDSILSDSLKDRKKELEKGLHGTLSFGDTEAGYASVVKAWIQRNYALPEIYELKSADIRAIVHLVLNKEGAIVKLSLEQSSHNKLFDELALKTVEKAAPFPTPPADWVGHTIVLPFEPKVSGL